MVDLYVTGHRCWRDKDGFRSSVEVEVKGPKVKVQIGSLRLNRFVKGSVKENINFGLRTVRGVTRGGYQVRSESSVWIRSRVYSSVRVCPVSPGPPL